MHIKSSIVNKAWNGTITVIYERCRSLPNLPEVLRTEQQEGSVSFEIQASNFYLCLPVMQFC